MRISISIVLLFVSSALLFNVGFGRHNPPYVTQFLIDRAAHAHPKVVSHAPHPKANCFGLMLDQFNNRYYVPAVRQSCADQRSPPKAPSKA
ncbi:hypothetical protein ACE6H2_017517 [Prunus campanulata]